jgi:hypothetical protein
MQKLVDFHFDITKKQQEGWVSTTAGWLQEAKMDKEIGGSNWDASEISAQRALKAFGSEGLNKVLSDYGMGNHPEIKRLLSRVGRAIVAEDNSGGKEKAANSGGERDVLTQFYGPKK